MGKQYGGMAGPTIWELVGKDGNIINGDISWDT
jgi:hypothetical protein